MWALEGQREEGGESDDCSDVKDALPWVGCPDDEQNEGVGEGELEDGATRSECGPDGHDGLTIV